MMKFALTLSRSLVLALALMGVAVAAFANEGGGHGEAKKEEPKEEEKKIEYVKEPGIEGRAGNLYKRVARDNKGTPELAPKLPPPPPPPKEEKEEKKDEGHGGGGDHGGGGHGEEPKKEEKKDKKEEKKKDDGGHGGGGHGGGHGGGEPEKKKPEPSKVYSRKVIKLDGNNRPLTEVMHTNKYADYFLCRDTISTRYRNIVLSEMNTFADRMGLPRAQEAPCMIKVAKPNTKFPGAIYIEFYVNEEAARACIRGGECGSTRLVMLFPKDKTGKSPEDIYRSYVITDERKFRRASYCVSPDGQLLGEKSCYVHLHPDWLFN